jgi:hypothetical protein
VGGRCVHGPPEAAAASVAIVCCAGNTDGLSGWTSATAKKKVKADKPAPRGGAGRGRSVDASARGGVAADDFKERKGRRGVSAAAAGRGSGRPGRAEGGKVGGASSKRESAPAPTQVVKGAWGEKPLTVAIAEKRDQSKHAPEVVPEVADASTHTDSKDDVVPAPTDAPPKRQKRPARKAEGAPAKSKHSSPPVVEDDASKKPAVRGAWALGAPGSAAARAAAEQKKREAEEAERERLRLEQEAVRLAAEAVEQARIAEQNRIAAEEAAAARARAEEEARIRKEAEAKRQREKEARERAIAEEAARQQRAEEARIAAARAERRARIPAAGVSMGVSGLSLPTVNLSAPRPAPPATQASSVVETEAPLGLGSGLILGSSDRTSAPSRGGSSSGRAPILASDLEAQFDPSSAQHVPEADSLPLPAPVAPQAKPSSQSATERSSVSAGIPATAATGMHDGLAPLGGMAPGAPTSDGHAASGGLPLMGAMGGWMNPAYMTPDAYSGYPYPYGGAAPNPRGSGVPPPGMLGGPQPMMGGFHTSGEVPSALQGSADRRPHSGSGRSGAQSGAPRPGSRGAQPTGGSGHGGMPPMGLGTMMGGHGGMMGGMMGAPMGGMMGDYAGMMPFPYGMGYGSHAMGSMGATGASSGFDGADTTATSTSTSFPGGSSLPGAPPGMPTGGMLPGYPYGYPGTAGGYAAYGYSAPFASSGPYGRGGSVPTSASGSGSGRGFEADTMGSAPTSMAFGDYGGYTVPGGNPSWGGGR